MLSMPHDANIRLGLSITLARQMWNLEYLPWAEGSAMEALGYSWSPMLLLASGSAPLLMLCVDHSLPSLEEAQADAATR